jgi:uncharacterized membrane protein
MFLIFCFCFVSSVVSQVLTKQEKDDGVIEPAQSVRTKVWTAALCFFFARQMCKIRVAHSSQICVPRL